MCRSLADSDSCLPRNAPYDCRPKTFFGNAYTLPEFRGTGVHTALLIARLNAAFELGVAVVYTDVEHQSPSHSHCERAGFRPLTITTIWAKPA